ncbi:MAG TPA: DUF4132 domain-containing protein, partial [Chloroflexota bacterium]
MATAEQLDWVEAERGYAVALRGGQVVARGPRGALLKSVPTPLRESDVVRQLRELRDWLSRHERECLATVETWMVRSQPVTRAVLQAVWPDPAWQRGLRDAVIVPLDEDAKPCDASTGFLRAVDPARGVGVVTLEGETVYRRAPLVSLPHPANLPELSDYRDFATELQIDQGISQLYRDTSTKPTDTRQAHDTWTGPPEPRQPHDASARTTDVEPRLTQGHEVIDAHVYTHAALGDRRVVRLVSHSLGPAEDAALAFFGLRLSEVAPSVARGPRQAPRFPGWVLANDPANGAYALDIAKDVERLVRLMRTRPAAARDGFDRLGRQLTRTAPHMLPVFYEHIGRIYIEAEQPAQAAVLFGRARDAEREHHLAIDMERQPEVFGEFALAGALSSQALESFADELQANESAAEAYATFRELCVA